MRFRPRSSSPTRRTSIARGSEIRTQPVSIDTIESVSLPHHQSYSSLQNQNTITLDLEIDTALAPAMHYFEVFLPRMLMSRPAAESLGYAFHITINDVSIL